MQASEEAIRLARQFMDRHAETIQHEIEYAAGGEVSLDAQNRLVVHEPPDSEASRLLAFMKAMSELAKTGSCDADTLKSGVQLIGIEIRATQEDAQASHRHAMKLKGKKRTLRLEESRELKEDVDTLLRVQGDLIDVLKSLGLSARRPPGAPEAGRGIG